MDCATELTASCCSPPLAFHRPAILTEPDCRSAEKLEPPRKAATHSVVLDTAREGTVIVQGQRGFRRNRNVESDPGDGRIGREGYAHNGEALSEALERERLRGLQCAETMLPAKIDARHQPFQADDRRKSCTYAQRAVSLAVKPGCARQRGCTARFGKGPGLRPDAGDTDIRLDGRQGRSETVAAFGKKLAGLLVLGVGVGLGQGGDGAGDVCVAPAEVAAQPQINGAVRPATIADDMTTMAASAAELAHGGGIAADIGAGQAQTQAIEQIQVCAGNESGTVMVETTGVTIPRNGTVSAKSRTPRDNALTLAVQVVQNGIANNAAVFYRCTAQRGMDIAGKLAKRALALAPGNPDIINLQGRAAFENQDLHGALEHFRRAVELNPDLADAFNNMGNVLKELGRLKDAQQAYAQSLAIDPDATGVYVNYADSVKFRPDDPHLATMQNMRNGAGTLSDTDRIHLDFSLAKAFADTGDKPRSFQHLLSGNALKRAQILYDESATLGYFERIEKTFTKSLLQDKQSLGAGDPADTPIFIVGMPRSGTTLVEQVLASHPRVFGAGELRFLHEAVNSSHNPGLTHYPELAQDLDAPTLRKIASRYVGQLRNLAPEALHVTDKMPSNFYFLGLVHLAMPHAKIIHVVRDPVDTCLSCFSKLFTEEQDYSYDLAELGRYYRGYEKLMRHWRTVLPQDRMLEVRYEDVVDDLERQARRMISHCGLEWDDNCLAFHKTDRPIRTASAVQVRQPIYRDAVGRAGFYEEWIAPLRAALKA